MENKNIYLVLGTARSGTSAITRGLKALGVSLGDTLTKPAPWNPVGFWEDNELVYQINERALKLLNLAWDSVILPSETAQTGPALNDLNLHAQHLLSSRLKATDHLGFKDPRTAKILYFWQAVFKKLNVQPHYLIALRNPLSCAQSYEKMTGAPLEHGLLLWITHLIAAVEGTIGKSRLIVSYDELMQAPRIELSRIQTAFSLNQANPNDIENYISTFLNKKFQHHTLASQKLESHPLLSRFPLCIPMYDLLHKVACDQLKFDDTAFVKAWQEIKDIYTENKPLNTYINSLIMQNHQLKKTLHSLHKSRLWKLIYPLRVIDNLLRAHRNKPTIYSMKQV